MVRTENGVWLALDVGSREITSALVDSNADEANQRMIAKSVQKLDGKLSQAQLLERCFETVAVLLNECGGRGLTPLGIGVSSKGNVRSGVLVVGKDGEDSLELERLLEEKFSLKTEMLNRFQAAALGVVMEDDSVEVGNVGEISVVVTLSSGVAEGAVIRHDDFVGILSYRGATQRQGAFGETIARRFKNEDEAKEAGFGKLEVKVADVLGSTGIIGRMKLLTGKEFTLNDVFELALFKAGAKDHEKARLVVDEAIDAAGGVVKEIQVHLAPAEVLLIGYPSEFTDILKNAFIFRVTGSANEKLGAHATDIGGVKVRISEIPEDDARLIGAERAARAEGDLDDLKQARRRGDRTVPHVLAVTGKPRAGKTTLVGGLIEQLSQQDQRVGGILCMEKRENGERVGFSMTDLFTGEETELATTISKLTGKPVDTKKSEAELASELSKLLGIEVNPRHIVGRKYLTRVGNVDRFAAKAIENALNNADIIVIDEVGPMQLLSEGFKNAVRSAVASGKQSVITVKFDKIGDERDSFVSWVKWHDNARLFVLSHDEQRNVGNRESICAQLTASLPAPSDKKVKLV